MKKSAIEINPQFARALEAAESGKSIMVTGRAGTGKSTFLQYFRDHTKKNLAVLAPTGVAAVNIKGQTIHSFFRFRPDITIDKVKKSYKKIRNAKLYQSLDAIVIDEISMVRADLLDVVDQFLRLHGRVKGAPFGGIQTIFIGDLYQLPPVVTNVERLLFSTVYQSPYFFDAASMKEFPLEMIELERIYRQKDDTFIAILNAVRNRSIEDDLLSVLNRRVIEGFLPAPHERYIHLVTTNAKAEMINAARLHTLHGRTYTFEGNVEGEFDTSSLPAPMTLRLKRSAQVMLTNNDRLDRWINGTVGVVEGIDRSDDGDAIIVTLENGETVDVTPYRWEMFRFVYQEEHRKIESETIGSFTQYPIIPAWALTIHKAQGKTFERVIVDMDRGAFAHGQTYVALSRCVSLDGLVLTTPIAKKHLLTDWRVMKFLTSKQYQKSEQETPLAQKVQLLRDAVSRRQSVEIVYLKSNDQKSRRVLRPEEIGEMEYLGKTFLGVSGFDQLRGESRVFRVDRILELRATTAPSA